MQQYSKYLWHPVLYLVAALQLFFGFIENHISSWTETLKSWNKSVSQKVNK